MNLQSKYAELISFATNNVKSLHIEEQGGVLHVNGAASSSVKDYLWKIYETIDPEMRSNDLVLSIDLADSEEQIYVIQPGDSLSKIAAKYPGMTWQKIFEANKDTIKNPDLIYPGKTIRIPL